MAELASGIADTDFYVDVFPNAGTEIGVDLYELYLGLAGQENRTARPSPAESPRGKTPKQHQQNSR